MIQLSNIKLIIWDLDETFWKGTLTEGGIVPIPENIQFIKDLTDRGIINAICSKNDKEPVDNILKELNVFEYFVFNSIDWTPKGPRISQLIKDVNLRPENVLFIDDNEINLNEALHYTPEMVVSTPTIIANLIEECSGMAVKDAEHKRLKQYQVLETKQRAKADAVDNISFLFSTNIQVEIHKDCLDKIDRIAELVSRTNQLNYTKLRSSKEELIELLKDADVDAGYISVKDNFGDYGIVGFYAVKEGKCIHFLFSCRTIGQGVEQYVYSTLGWPMLETVGNVANPVEKVVAPLWINQRLSVREETKETKRGKVVIKGACDLSMMASFLNFSCVVGEFTYIGKQRHNDIEHHNHSVNYLKLPFLSLEEREKLMKECIFCDEEMFNTQIYDRDVDAVFVSSLIEANLGIYRNKETGLEIAFAEHYNRLTDPKMWSKYINHEVNNYGNEFTYEWFEKFSSKWDYVGRMTPERFVDNLETLLSRIAPHAIVCVMMGSEIPYLKNTDLTYDNRHEEHKQFNQKLREFAAKNNRVHLINITDYIKSQDDFTNNINHYKRRVYYEIAKRANEIIEVSTGEHSRNKGKLYIVKTEIVSRLYRIKIGSTNLQELLLKVYHWIKK